MLAALLLVAAGAFTPARSPARTVDQRVSLLEARQMLESQALWGLQATLHPDALKAVADLDLHVAQDRERDEQLRGMADKVATLEQRLRAIEAALGDRAVLEGAMQVQPEPAQIGEPSIMVRQAAKPAAVKRTPASKLHAAEKGGHGKKAARLQGPRYADAKR